MTIETGLSIYNKALNDDAEGTVMDLHKVVAHLIGAISLAEKNISASPENIAEWKIALKRLEARGIK